jgi:hypothetical protein
MPHHVKMILLGTLLGDGSLSIQKNYANARFQMRHSSMQKKWFDWKSEALASLGTNKAIHFQKPDGFQRSRPANHPPNEPWGKWHFQTRALPELTKIYDVVRKGKKKNVQRSWLNHLDARALMVWWCDDGGLTSKLKKGHISTHGFTLGEIKILSKYLKVVWNLDNIIGKVHKKNVEYYVIRLNTTNLKKLIRLIAPFIPVASMVYKLCVGYVDRELQQRWISELKGLVPSEFASKVDQFYLRFNQKREQRRRQRMI